MLSGLKFFPGASSPSRTLGSKTSHNRHPAIECRTIQRIIQPKAVKMLPAKNTVSHVKVANVVFLCFRPSRTLILGVSLDPSSLPEMTRIWPCRISVFHMSFMRIAIYTNISFARMSTGVMPATTLYCLIWWGSKIASNHQDHHPVNPVHLLPSLRVWCPIMRK